MPKYKLTMIAEVEIEAENIVEASWIANEIRPIKVHRAGSRKPLHNKYPIRYTTDLISVNRKVERIRE